MYIGKSTDFVNFTFFCFEGSDTVFKYGFNFFAVFIFNKNHFSVIFKRAVIAAKGFDFTAFQLALKPLKAYFKAAACAYAADFANLPAVG